MFKKIGGFGLPLLFIWPVGGFFASLFDLKSKRSAFVYVAFAMLFGYAISFADPSADSYRYAQAFSRFDNTLDYNTIVQMYRNGELKDMYRLFIFYFTSIFTNNPKVMYAFAGMVYGIFSYLSLRIFVKESGVFWDRFILIMALVFYTYVSLSNINAFRFNTGGLILFYAAYQLIIKNKMIWGLGILILPLIHYGFILMVPIIMIYVLVVKFLYSKEGVNVFLFYAFILAFAASWILETNQINLGFLSEADALSGATGGRMKYINSDKVTEIVEARSESSTFITIRTYFSYAIKIFVLITVLKLKSLLKRATGDKTEFTRLFAFVLFLYVVGFIASSIPSGSRFLAIAHLFLMILLAKFYAIYKGKDLKRVIFLALLVFSFNIAFINFMLPYLILTKTFWYGNLFWIIIEGIDFYI